MTTEERECHWSGWPFFMCNDDAEAHIILYAMMGEQRIEEEFYVCKDHARIQCNNAILRRFHVVVKPLSPVKIEWQEDLDED